MQDFIILRGGGRSQPCQRIAIVPRHPRRWVLLQFLRVPLQLGEIVGGCGFKDKWGTPDVIGIRKARESDLIKCPTEIISAEVKTDSSNLITAFGQACSYRLFSHRSYLVVPKSALSEDLDRLESLCIACGLGLILFDCQNVSNPNFAIRVRAIRTEPDMFYVNRNLKLIEQKMFD